MTFLAGSAVPERRSRAHLAVVVAEWALSRHLEGGPVDDPPESLFRPDEISEVESLDGGELLIAAGWLVEAVAINMAAKGRPNAGRMLGFADSLYSQAERRYAPRAPRCRPQARTRSLGRRRLRSRRCQGRAPPAGDDPDLEHRARHGRLR